MTLIMTHVVLMMFVSSQSLPKEIWLPLILVNYNSYTTGFPYFLPQMFVPHMFSNKIAFLWGFPSMGVPKARWIVYFMENPI